jgi:GNAT superfamily N-acetyltransferase
MLTLTVRVLRPDDAPVLDRVVEGVFDGPINAQWAAEFLADARHHLAVALDGGLVVGKASGVHYVHPDKAPELWVNEVGVAPVYQNRGVGRRLLTALFERGQAVGCTEAWVLTERVNTPARRLYAAAGGVESPDDLVMVSFRLATAERLHPAGGDGSEQPRPGRPCT